MACRRMPGLMEKGWLRIHATYKERLAFLFANKAKAEELANASTVFDIIPIPRKRNNNPTSPLLFWLCGIAALRFKA